VQVNLFRDEAFASAERASLRFGMRLDYAASDDRHTTTFEVEVSRRLSKNLGESGRVKKNREESSMNHDFLSTKFAVF